MQVGCKYHPHKMSEVKAVMMEQKKAAYQSIEDSQVLYIFANRFKNLNDISGKNEKDRFSVA